MPEGQFSGTRGTYIYLADNGTTKYTLTLDDTLASLAGADLTKATTGNITGVSAAPKRFKPRIVHWKGTLNSKPVTKRLVCGTTTATLYNKDVSQTLTIDGVAGSTSGRRGERMSFPTIGAAAAPTGP